MGATAKKVLGYVLAAILILGALLLVSMGFKELRIGGVLGSLLGKKEPKTPTDIINSTPSGRIGKDGKPIGLGVPDTKGIKQVEIVSVIEDGLFSDPKTIQIKEPQTQKVIDIQVPEGVSKKDIDRVVVIESDHYVIAVKNNSKVATSDLGSLIEKYE